MFKKTEQYAAVLVNHIQKDYPDSYPRALAIQHLQEMLLWISESPHGEAVNSKGEELEISDSRGGMFSFTSPAVPPSDS